MAESMTLMPALLEGCLLGFFFFGGLWWTVRKGIKAERVAFYFIASMLLRTGVVMLGFYLLMGDSWLKMLVGLLGFSLARMIVLRRTKGRSPINRLAQEADHAAQP